VTLYFVTSSDSGSFVDDTLSAQGMLHCPYAQRVYWAFTEGACAIALMFAGGSNALKALQAVSIVSGFPLTMAISYMCAALLRACKYDCMEDEIYLATRFRTGLFDSLEGFKPNVFAVRVDPVTGKRDKIAIKLPEVGERVQSLVISLFAPFVTVHDMNVQLWKTSGIFYTVPLGIMFFCWIGCMFGELDNPLTSYIGWTIYMFFVAELTFIRCKAREAYNVYGFWLEDLFACMVMWPYVASQLSLQAKHVEVEVDINLDPNAHLNKPAAVKEESPLQPGVPDMQVTQMNAPLPVMPSPTSYSPVMYGVVDPNMQHGVA